MGRYKDPVFHRAQAGSRPFHRYDPKRGSVAQAVASSSAATDIAHFKAKAVTPAEWTAVTTGYPGAPHDGTPTYYQADVAHGLNNTRTVVAGMQDAAGRDVRMQIVEATNDDPASPGTLRQNITRLWISQDAAPAANLYIMFVG